MSRVCKAAGIGSSVERPLTSKEKLPGAEPFAAALAWYSCTYTTLPFSKAVGLLQLCIFTECADNSLLGF